MVGASTSGLRARIAAGDVLLGTFIDLGSPVAAEIVATAGFDWLVLDLEHGAGGRDATLAQLHAVRAPMVVRVPSAAGEELGWVLDMGAAGVVVPRVEGLADAAAVVERTRYAGSRGLHGGVRAAAFGRDAGYRERADDERVVMVQIETRGALDEAAEIAALPGVDVLFLGPYDLGHALGLPPGPESPEMQAIAERVCGAARGAGKAAAVFLGEPALVARYRELGFTLIASGSAAGLLAASSAERLAALRA
jgi:2-dehydro-3-deoxyglucarate aldolase/4-hydroxy-2-oxoheptanedioate aldolase